MADLVDLTPRLVDSGIYSKYQAWSQEYRQWRTGQSQGAQGEVTACGRSQAERDAAWRDGYRRWRQGRPRGARGETRCACAKPLAAAAADANTVAPAPKPLRRRSVLPAVVYDVVAMEGAGTPALVPVDGPSVAPIPVGDFPEEALVTIRTFRFFEDRKDEKQVWEQELRNVNSGSLLWLPVHLEPGVHSKSGAKYGTWFTIHYLQVYAKHFKSRYFMAEEGCCAPAKTFGSTRANTVTVTGSSLKDGYFWYVTPSRGEASLEKEGWQHLFRAGPFDGSAVLEEWRKTGSPMEPRALQRVLDTITERAP